MEKYSKEEWAKILRRDGTKLKLVKGELKNDIDLIIDALNSTLVALQYVDKSLADNKEFVLRGIKETPWALFIYKFASKKVRDDEDVVKEALARDGEVMAFADKHYQNWLEYAFLALRAEKNPTIKYFSEGLRGNREIMAEVVRRDPSQMNFIADKLRRDVSFLVKVCRNNKKLLELVDDDIVEDVKEGIFEVYNNEPQRF